ncbi:hypothetical protein MTO96_021410 [Rhipicephalus appendiculatus]
MHLNAHYHTAPGHCEAVVPCQSPWHYPNHELHVTRGGRHHSKAFISVTHKARLPQYKISMKCHCTQHTHRAHLDWLNQKQIVIHTSDFVLCYILCYAHTHYIINP